MHAFRIRKQRDVLIFFPIFFFLLFAIFKKGLYLDAVNCTCVPVYRSYHGFPASFIIRKQDYYVIMQ